MFFFVNSVTSDRPRCWFNVFVTNFILNISGLLQIEITKIVIYLDIRTTQQCYPSLASRSDSGSGSGIGAWCWCSAIRIRFRHASRNERNEAYDEHCNHQKLIRKSFQFNYYCDTTHDTCTVIIIYSQLGKTWCIPERVSCWIPRNTKFSY